MIFSQGRLIEGAANPAGKPVDDGRFVLDYKTEPGRFEPHGRGKVCRKRSKADAVFFGGHKGGSSSAAG